MPRNSGGVYSAPAGTLAVPTETIESAPYNAFVADLEVIANEARPVSVGGTGQTSIAGIQASFKIAPFDAASTISGNWTFTGNVDFTSATITGAGVADGDKGDISVSSSGSVWTINDAAIESAMLADGSFGAFFVSSGVATLSSESVTIANLNPALLVAESEGIDSNDNDTTVPTSAAVKDYVDTRGAGWELVSNFYSGATASSVETPNFEDGYEYRIVGNDIRGGTIQAEVYWENDAAYSAPVSFGVGGNTLSTSFDLSLPNTRLSRRVFIGFVDAAAAIINDPGSIVNSASISIGRPAPNDPGADTALRLRISATTTSFTTGNMWLLRRPDPITQV